MHLKKRRRRRRFLLALGLLAAGLIAFVKLRWQPTVRTLVAVQVDNEASNLIVEAINEQIASGAIQYDKIITLRTDADGRVSALQTDMAEINRLKMEILRRIGQDLRELSVEQLSVPLGNVLLPSRLSGVGGFVPVRLVELRSSGADFESSFSQAGINQTLHQIGLNVKIHVIVLTPAGEMDVPVQVRMVVAQTILLGEVPQTVFNFGGTETWTQEKKSDN